MKERAMNRRRQGKAVVAAGAYSPAERRRLLGRVQQHGPAFEGREAHAQAGKLRWAQGAGPGLLRGEDVAPVPRVPGEAGELIDFESVEARLVEAFETLWRLPDTSPGPRLRTMALWREVVPDRADIDSTPTPGRPGVSRREMARMDEALGWCEWLTPEARRVVGAAVGWQAAGRGELRWAEIRRRLGVETTTEALRKVYSRSLSRICGRLNRGR